MHFTRPALANLALPPGKSEHIVFDDALHGFGRFKVTERSARKGRNPQNGEPVKIPASKRVKFEAAQAFKESVNKKRRTSRKAA